MELHVGIFRNSWPQTFPKVLKRKLATRKTVDNIRFSDDFRGRELINLLKMLNIQNKIW